MATITANFQKFHFPFNRNRVILFSILAILTLYVVYAELDFFESASPKLHRYKEMSWILIPHGLLGMIALVAGPFQFSGTLRRQRVKLHRNIGKIYIISILLATPFAILLNIWYRIPGANITFVLENITQALVWAFTASMAWVAAWRRQITIHKMWAARSYGLTMVFVLSRIKNPMTLFMDKPDINDFAHFLWLLIVLALIIPDVLVFSKELFVPKKSSQKA